MEPSEILHRGAANVIVLEELEALLKSKKCLRIKLGIDPTGSELHLGHSVVLRKLRQFQERGDSVIFLIGDFTARIGDPTEKSSTRKMLTEAEIKKNMAEYVAQASKILDPKKIEIRHNSEWFSKMSTSDVIEMAAKKSVFQLLQREDFKKRWQSQIDLSAAEILYPIMQGYDSVMLECDVEVGGTDQLFNMLVGRDLQKAYGCKTIQQVLTVPILEGLDGVEKMSKSLGNYIGLAEAPEQMYGKIMSIPDSMMLKYFELATDILLDELKKMKQALKEGENPRNLKMRLGRELVQMYHGEKEASEAEANFVKVFQKHETPEDVELKKLPVKEIPIVNLLVETKLASSKSEARRLIQGGGVKLDSQKIDDYELKVSLAKERLLQVGKRKFLRVKFV